MAGGEERVVGGDEVLHSAAALRAALHLGRVVEPADLAHQILQNRRRGRIVEQTGDLLQTDGLLLRALSSLTSNQCKRELKLVRSLERLN